MNKKLFTICAIMLLSVVLLITGCGEKEKAPKETTKAAVTEDTKEAPKEDVKEESKEASKEPEKAPEKKNLRVASHVEPMTTIVKLAALEALKDGYTLELVHVSDNVQPNQILNSKEIDANFFQHVPYMQKFNEANKGNLVPIQTIYDALVGFYSKNHKDIKDLPENATIAIPNDPANEGRALAILDSYGLIKLKKDVKYNATVEDIEENPKSFKILKIDLVNLIYAYDEADLVFNYPSYIKALDLTPKNDALILEKSDGYFGIALVAREDNKDSSEIKALKKFMTSEAVKKFIVEDMGEVIVPSF